MLQTENSPGHGSVPLDDVGYGLGIGRVDDPDQRGQKRGRAGAGFFHAREREHFLQEQQNAERGEDEDQEIDDMVSERIKPVEIIIERKGKVGQRPVMSEVLERGAKKGCGFKVRNLDVIVINDGALVVKMERGLEARQINNKAISDSRTHCAIINCPSGFHKLQTLFLY